MEKSEKPIADVLIRYIILFVIAIPDLWLFYLIFTPLTIYPVYFLLNLFFESTLIGNAIIISGCFPIEIVEACVAGSAYYFLMILNLSTPKIKFKKRITILGISFASLLLLNILRIFFLSLLFVSGSAWFDITHKIFWYLISTLFVVVIWFAEVKYFKIKEIPIYSDFIFLKKLIKK